MATPKYFKKAIVRNCSWQFYITANYSYKQQNVSYLVLKPRA